jgi:hypothetical protein
MAVKSIQRSLKIIALRSFPSRPNFATRDQAEVIVDREANLHQQQTPESMACVRSTTFWKAQSLAKLTHCYPRSIHD